MNDDIRRTIDGANGRRSVGTANSSAGTAASSARSAGSRRNRQRKTAPWLAVTLLLIVAAVGWLGTSLSATGSVAGDVTEDTVINSESPTAPELALAVTAQPLHWADGTVYILTLGAMATTFEETAAFNSGQLYDFVVTQDGREVWRWSQGRAFHQAFVTRTFTGGELHAFSEVWDGRDAHGEPVTGTVEVRGVLTSIAPLETDAVQLELE